MIEQLLEAIYASPDDDAPRLVYADALLERGDPRGELIVRQCRGDAASDLVEQFGQLWLGELAPNLTAAAFERGFLHNVVVRDLLVAKEIDALVGHPIWRTVREFRGPLAIALHPSMTALRTLHAMPIDDQWRELLLGAPRAITELHYEPVIDEDWDAGSDHTATPMSGGNWTLRVNADEMAALGACTALPSLRRLVLHNVPETSLGFVLGSGLIDRVPIVESHHGPIAVRIGGGIAALTLAPTASPHYTDMILGLVRRLPARLGITLTTGPRFDRTQVERVLGPRLRR